MRRSDILQRRRIADGYTTPDRHYLRRAMNYFANTTKFVQFVVVSDDLAWVKVAIAENGAIGSNNTSVVFSREANLAAVDLAMLSRCDGGVIMTTGSFGWWGAWLANRTTVYYRNWPKPGTWLDKKFKRDDFFPPSWISMT